MSNLDQCPSTTKGEKKRPSKAELALLPAVAGSVHAPAGLRAWRSLDEVADTAEFRDFLEREFPAGASELERSESDTAEGGETRRQFLKVMGASIALAGAATIPGCRRPEHKIMPYSREVPEEIIPGKPLFYATSFARPDGGAEGLLVETHEGRPTKIEGNPLHPLNQGKPSIWAMASILGLYDPDRLKFPVYLNPARKERLPASWDDFKTWANQNLSQYDGNGGQGLAVLADKKSSPSRQAAIAAFRQKYPRAMWVSYSPLESTGMTEGTRAAFGAPMREQLNITRDNTRVVVSLDRDFLSKDPAETRNSRQFAATRMVLSTKDTMSRLYCVECGFSTTGAQADHRLRLSPLRVTAFAVALAQQILRQGVAGGDAAALSSAIANVQVPPFSTNADELKQQQLFLQECAKDLIDAANRGKSLILAGESQPPAVHALVIAMNAALGNLGASVSYLPMGEEEAASSIAGIQQLAQAMGTGAIRTLVCINTNPVYDAPGDLKFNDLFARVPHTITLTTEATETAAASTWALNASHYLESWGDTQAWDGTLAPVQPMIAPLYEPSLSDLEFIAYLTNRAAERIDGYELVRATWQRILQGDFEKAWRRALHDGVVANTSQSVQRPNVNFGNIAGLLQNLGNLSSQGLEVVFQSGMTADGRYANISWLQELPDPASKVVWDNPILMSPRTAMELNCEPASFNEQDPNQIYTKEKYPHGKLITLTVNGVTVTGPVWVLPGMADMTAICMFGYGRQSAGLVGDGVGFNAFPLRTTAAIGGRTLSNVEKGDAPGYHMIASTQNHWSMEGRTSIVRAVDLPRFQKFGDSVMPVAHLGMQDTLNFGEQLGELSHTPPNVSIYKNPFNKSVDEPKPDAMYSKGPQWAMTIDQTVCTGCGACTLACQAENNIPVVGKKEVAKGREMHWIRVDRYFVSDVVAGKMTDVNNPVAMYTQPVLCVHCENAPCETVCPVNATVHGPEGINYMTYNRCIGTRYCANNCPYKVRRFNFFDYGVTKFNGSYYGKDAIDKVGGVIPGQGTGITGSGQHNQLNPNLIPPRLRQKLDEIERMQKNPNVTVRSRGVMEKCSYCIQRINAARIETKLQNLPGIPDGFFQVACQQACPTDAITFGDQLDKGSRVHAMRKNARSYALLGYLNTRPRTSHMVRVMNPKRELCSADRVAEWDKPLGHGEHDHGGHPDADHPGKTSFVSPSRQRDDRGYALSLRVLGAKA
ncbi:MAG TPA: TAT-variant-translocated molybdopterin oxidoreductase [Phycisphaerales bacterium]|nr:TAT-variant-translocated molybdopterin oxidoreductase [Phycisphaerales bacterium]